MLELVALNCLIIALITPLMLPLTGRPMAPLLLPGHRLAARQQAKRKQRRPTSKRPAAFPQYQVATQATIAPLPPMPPAFAIPEKDEPNGQRAADMKSIMTKEAAASSEANHGVSAVVEASDEAANDDAWLDELGDWRELVRPYAG